jgi:hypothetical protein
VENQIQPEIERRVSSMLPQIGWKENSIQSSGDDIKSFQSMKVFPLLTAIGRLACRASLETRKNQNVSL